MVFNVLKGLSKEICGVGGGGVKIIPIDRYLYQDRPLIVFFGPQKIFFSKIVSGSDIVFLSVKNVFTEMTTYIIVSLRPIGLSQKDSSVNDHAAEKKNIKTYC
jgi:hypothetical protein